MIAVQRHVNANRSLCVKLQVRIGKPAQTVKDRQRETMHTLVVTTLPTMG